jgi:hypothetical protein
MSARRCAPLLKFQRKDQELVSALTTIILTRNSLLMVFSKALTSPLLRALDLRLQLGLIIERPARQSFLHLL